MELVEIMGEPVITLKLTSSELQHVVGCVGAGTQSQADRLKLDLDTGILYDSLLRILTDKLKIKEPLY